MQRLVEHGINGALQLKEVTNGINQKVIQTYCYFFIFLHADVSMPLPICMGSNDKGIDPQEAQARIDSLSDAEVNDIVDKLDQLPAGGVLGTILIISFLVFLILLLTDIAGYTDIFPFVKKK
jgi:hypothetical protein